MRNNFADFAEMKSVDSKVRAGVISKLNWFHARLKKSSKSFLDKQKLGSRKRIFESKQIEAKKVDYEKVCNELFSLC